MFKTLGISVDGDVFEGEISIEDGNVEFINIEISNDMSIEKVEKAIEELKLIHLKMIECKESKESSK